MSRPRRGAPASHSNCAAFLCLLVCALAPPTLKAGDAAGAGQSPPGTAISLDDYRARLAKLDRLVAACQQAPGPANCQSGQVGSDTLVKLPSGTRQVRFNWLRGVLAEAAESAGDHPKDVIQKTPVAKEKPATGEDSNPEDRSPPQDGIRSLRDPEYARPTAAQQLSDARERLAADAAQAGWPPSSAASSLSASRARLNAILAAKEYHAAVAQPSLWDQVLEKIGNWIDRIFGQLAEAGRKSPWIGRMAEIGFLVLMLAGLIWFLIRLERHGRLGPSMLASNPGSGAASARDWQLWLSDASKAASRSAWREAIHLLYWASISRLESSGQWPADRARTPREYLALLSPQSPLRADLAAITRSFERTWYAGLAAGEADFRIAEQTAARLGAGRGTR